MEGANMAGFTLVGVPSSAGTHGIGQEQAPLQFRRAWLVDRLIAARIEIIDDGDLPLALYRTRSPDRHQQNLGQVVTVAQRVAGKVDHVVAAGRVPVVLGGALSPSAWSPGCSVTSRELAWCTLTATPT
jgi:arginase